MLIMATIRVSGNLAKMWSLTNISKKYKAYKGQEKKLLLLRQCMNMTVKNLKADYFLLPGITIIWELVKLSGRLKALMLNGRQ